MTTVKGVQFLTGQGFFGQIYPLTATTITCILAIQRQIDTNKITRRFVKNLSKISISLTNSEMKFGRGFQSHSNETLVFNIC